MKKVCSFYYTGEEQRWLNKKERLFGILRFLFLFFFVLFDSVCIFFYALNFHFSDTQRYLIIMFALILDFLIILFIILEACSKNTSPTQLFWNEKQEYIIEENKVTIHIIMPSGLSKMDEFFIKKKLEKPEGTYFYNGFNYYIFIPRRVTPTIVND